MRRFPLRKVTTQSCCASTVSISSALSVNCVLSSRVSVTMADDTKKNVSLQDRRSELWDSEGLDV